METPVVEEYLEAIYKLHGLDKTLGSTELGKELAVSPASATEMVNRLVEKGLVARDRKKGIFLTAKGRKSALALVRKHRISERFLVDVLGMDWKDVHDEACRFEHVLSAEVESRMDAMLGHPATCPHGNPIPDRLGRTPAEKVRRLSGLARGRSGVISKITEERRDLLEYLATLGLLPGRTVKIEQIAPFNGPMLVCAGDARYALGREVADKIWIKAE